ncbi:MAG: NUDIX hydrolase [Thermoplasmata archaeon]|nr:NUDIX hydrolase [Thermoplasmata archaeon]RLF27734.1 MAG: ADP-ribose pyrophosphatase [Thermoplasmata archaeon]
MKYRKPSVTVDGIITKDNEILLVKRKNNPFRGKWALPGGFVNYGEKVEDAVIREVKEETGVSTRIIKLFGVYSDPSRDPRGHTISVVFILKPETEEVKGGDDAVDARFFPLDSIPPLAFDHDKIIMDYKQKEMIS